MFRPLVPSHRRPARRGTSILLIALIMLTLFSAVGTAYVFYAIREAKLAEARKEEQGAFNTAQVVLPDPSGTINTFFGTLIYDVGDGSPPNSSDLLNGMRGHSIARSMYGRDVLAQNGGPSGTPQGALGQSWQSAIQLSQALTTPWAGVGLFHEIADTTNTTYAPYKLPTGTDRAQLINYNLMVMNGSALLLDPEYMGVRPMTTAGTVTTVGAFDPTSRNYIGKHAGYSYPDVKDFFAGAVDPATGQVLLQSFYRPAIFGSLDPSNANWTNQQGRLLTLRPRPGPTAAPEHPNFPTVPQNADGTYTGDVQNWPGGGLTVVDSSGNITTAQRNDSLWLNMGLPIITLPNGQKVQPLVAPLIVPLNGLLNPSAHGNAYFTGSSGAQHGSYAGYGPWEVNMAYALGSTNGYSADANAIVGGRGSTSYQQRDGVNTRAYAPYSTGGPLPSYAPVAWDSTTIGTPLTYPTGNSMFGLPGFTNPLPTPGNAPNAPTPYQNSNTAVPSHPSLFNPTEWPTATTSAIPYRVFPLGDTRRLQRYATTPNTYNQMQVGQYAKNELLGTTGFYYNTAQTTPANYAYRTDLSHTMRGLFTTRGFDLDRPKLVPNFVSRDSSALAYGTNTNAPNKPGIVFSGNYPSPSALGTTTDFAASNRWSNAMAALGSVDLNRPLADYRTDTTKPLSGTNYNTTATQPNIDRQQLARDIFARLAVATGAALTMSTTAVAYPNYQYTIPTSVTATSISMGSQYNALRYLAQLAANIVDYIDNDDISTAFVWNPNSTTDIVYGVEKPRLIINEAYAEITNDQADPVNGANATSFPTNPVQVRVWAELLNPTATLNPATGPIGDGSVQLSAIAGGSPPYQIQIRRETRITGTSPDGNATLGQNQAVALFGTPSNATGNFSSTADAIFPLTSSTVTSVSPNNAAYSPPSASLAAGGIVLVGPPTPNPQKTGSDEFSPNGGVWTNMITSPALSSAPSSPGMGYTFNLPTTNSTLSSAEFKRHIILLQRLANPYAAVNDPSSGSYNSSQAANTYITVDMMDYVPAFDAVCRGAKDAMNRNPWSATNTNGYDPVSDTTAGNNRFSVGKVQPFAGHAMITQANGTPIARTGTGTLSSGSYNTYTFGSTTASQASMVLPQLPAGSTATPAQPRHTFGMHNGANGSQPANSTFVAGNSTTAAQLTSTGASGGSAETLMTPFDWYVHMDRPLVNQIEVFQVRDTPAYRVTDQFILGSTSTTTSSGITYASGIARWRNTTDGLARGLEYLTVKPYTVGVPYGGRVPGKIGVNVLQDQRVFYGLFDPQNGNGFDVPGFLNVSGSANGSAWNGWMSTRDMGGVATRLLPNGSGSQAVAGLPAQTIFDTNVVSTTSGSTTTNYGRPFLSFGAPAVTPPGTQSATSTIAFGASGIGGTSTSTPNADLTILRTDTNPLPYLYTNSKSRATGGPTYPASHPNGPGYMQTEAVRKIMNNTTTVSHTYLVFLTIGYFNVTNLNPTPPAGWPSNGPSPPPQLGSEAFITVPGDMRQKVVAVIDMTNMALDPTTNQIASPQTVSSGNTVPGQPFFTSLESTTLASSADATGQVVLNIPYSSFDGTNVFVASNGQEQAISPNSPFNTLVLGYGADQQLVTVQSVGVSSGLAQVKVKAANSTIPFRTVYAGTCVSNVRPGYPGPQSGFSYTVPTALIPYLDRLR